MVIPGKIQVKPAQSQKFLPSPLATQPVIKGNETKIAIIKGIIGNASILELFKFRTNVLNNFPLEQVL